MSEKSKPLGIAMVVASPFPANHGTPGSIREMSEAVAQKGHSVHIVTYHFGEGVLPKGVSIHRVNPFWFKKKVVVGPTWEKPILDLLMVFVLCRVILREKIDLIHAHNYEGAMVGYLAKIITRKPLIYHAVNTMRDELSTYNFIKSKWLTAALARFLDYFVPRMADRIIAISEEIARFLSLQGILSGKIEMIPLGINLASLNQMQPREDAQGSPAKREGGLVIYTGLLNGFQRIDYLLRAMRIVVDRISTAKLLIVSNIADAEALEECRSMIKALQIDDHVEILTDIPFETTASLLAMADVCVLPRPNCPGFPVKLLNYLASAKPIVLFEGSSKGLLHLKHAFLVKDHDWEGIGFGIVTLLQDIPLAETLGKNGYQWASENLSYLTLVEKIDKVYADVMAHHAFVKKWCNKDKRWRSISIKKTSPMS